MKKNRPLTFSEYVRKSRKGMGLNERYKAYTRYLLKKQKDKKKKGF